MEPVGRNIRRYLAYPRVVGETGGKDFVFARSAPLFNHLIRPQQQGGGIVRPSAFAVFPIARSRLVV